MSSDMDHTDGLPAEQPESAEPANAHELLADLRSLADDAGSSDAREEIRETKALLREARERGLIDSGVRELEPSDAVQALAGSIIFASPLLVEDGVFDIAAYLLSVTVAGVPVFFVANTLFVVVMTHALLEWTGRDKQDTHRYFGFFSLRLLMILGVSFAAVAVLMTVWGRIDILGAPVRALGRVSVLWTVASLGAGLGDILSESASS